MKLTFCSDGVWLPRPILPGSRLLPKSSIRRAGAKTATAANARWMIGETYFHQENYAAALVEYQKVEQEHAFPRWQAAALLEAAKCYELLGHWPAAAETYSRLLKTFPDSPFNEEAGRVCPRCAQSHAAETGRSAQMK